MPEVVHFHNSLGSGQILHCPYDYEKAKLVVQKMTGLLVPDLVDKGFFTNQVVLTIGSDIENVSDKRHHALLRQTTTERKFRNTHNGQDILTNTAVPHGRSPPS